jgi:hypothetical protein
MVLQPDECSASVYKRGDTARWRMTEGVRQRGRIEGSDRGVRQRGYEE